MFIRKETKKKTIVSLSWKLSWLQFLSKPNILIFKVGQRVLFGTDITMAGVDVPWLRQKLGIVVLV